MDPLLTVLIPTYKNPGQLNGCLISLMTYVEYPLKIVILNNDGGNEVARDLLDRQIAVDPTGTLSVVHLGTNLGWTGALNVGLKAVETPFVCCLNDDVVFIPWMRDFFRRLCGWFVHEKVAAVGPCSNFVSGAQNLSLHYLPPTIAAAALIGFCMVARTKVIREVGGWDEEIPGGDDLDISIRITSAGYYLLVDRSVYLHHIGCQTGLRVHGDYWNSDAYGARTINALVKKHGLRKWYDCNEGRVRGYNSDDLRSVDGKKEGCHDWLRGKYEELGLEAGTGLNLGAGAQGDLGPNLDIRKAGERGAGGTKRVGATPDLTADAADLPVATGSLDYLVASHLLEHLVDPVTALGEWRRALRPDGVLLLACPDEEQLDTIILDATHFHAYTKASLWGLLEVCGWTVDEAETLMDGSFVMKVTPGRTGGPN